MTPQDITKEAYQEKIEAQVREIDAEIEKLKAKANRVKADAKLEYSEHIDKLTARREHMEARLEELRDASRDAWKDVRDGVDAAVTDLHIAVKDAVTRFEHI